ncbi:MAG TPA: hypothetical protein DDY68_03275 [Porphyromonadaceae bacterium]|nr:hypothetical protein [Porphyromonadaceae bacterium]
MDKKGIRREDIPTLNNDMLMECIEKGVFTKEEIVESITDAKRKGWEKKIEKLKKSLGEETTPLSPDESGDEDIKPKDLPTKPEDKGNGTKVKPPVKIKEPIDVYEGVKEDEGVRTMKRIDPQQPREEQMAYYNAFQLKDIQEALKDSVINEQDLQIAGFPDRLISRIRDLGENPDVFRGVAKKEWPKELEQNRTEVYFWGVPSSGKTCVFGTILSMLNEEGNLTVESEGAREYTDRLMGIFERGKTFVLPMSTSYNCIAPMYVKIRDGNEKNHKLIFIDIPGEVIIGHYQKDIGKYITEEIEGTTSKVCEYSKDERNLKIHFFIVAYEEAREKRDGVLTRDYLSHIAEYIKKKKIFHKNTNGIYILLTKCDKIKNWNNLTDEEKREEAEIHVKRECLSFYNVLEEISKKEGIANFKVLPFSIGEVYFQDVCVFDDQNAKSLANELIRKSAIEKEGFWSKLSDFFNN